MTWLIDAWMEIYEGYQHGDLTARQVRARKGVIRRRLNIEKRERIAALQAATPACRCRELLAMARWIHDIPITSRYALVHREVVGWATCFRDLADLGGTRCRNGFWVRIRPPFGKWLHALPAGFYTGLVWVRVGRIEHALAAVQACVPGGIEVVVDDLGNARLHGLKPMWRLAGDNFLAWLEFGRIDGGDLHMCGPFLSTQPDILGFRGWVWAGQEWGQPVYIQDGLG
ncbi:hypothetical protein Sp245p_28990 (plasmid) [Azospirillum baldaniorum]|uniref:Uncharacterized protein n=1 Tax=Azospirillum baldaniorum TaxID=1064539 RepID=A0A9P1JY82_9PROT|nr:hypothetical protein [Azospirillum baldaniorum]AWJ93858.1 hypothetical protein Sp245p_28990 [Azospirillum baldaniorum]TWA81683.1 hypothetical protein FBZ85_10257 [Azospirillum brasilense]CCD02019.1 protein of unknown function [Azospirillum baldaniorum]